MGLRRPDVAYIPTPPETVNAMLNLVNVTAVDVLYDLGCGDGRVVIMAAQQGASGVGIDIDAQRIQEAQENAKLAGVSDRAKFHQQDLFACHFSEATVIVLYLLPHLNLRLRPRLQQLKPGTRIVSRDFDLGDWLPDQVLPIAAPEECTLYSWIVPEP